MDLLYRIIPVGHVVSETDKHREGGKGGDVLRPALGSIPIRDRDRVRVGHCPLADYFGGLKGWGRKWGRIYAREYRIDDDVV
jgi:hypothetical protein